MIVLWLRLSKFGPKLALAPSRSHARAHARAGAAASQASQKNETDFPHLNRSAVWPIMSTLVRNDLDKLKAPDTGPRSYGAECGIVVFLQRPRLLRPGARFRHICAAGRGEACAYVLSLDVSSLTWAAGDAPAALFLCRGFSGVDQSSAPTTAAGCPAIRTRPGGVSCAHVLVWRGRRGNRETVENDRRKRACVCPARLLQAVHTLARGGAAR